MDNNLLNNLEKYRSFLKKIEKRISEKEFEKKLIEIQKIDLKHYTKKVTIQDFKRYIVEYENKEFKENKFKIFQILLPGNPEIVFKLCLEAIGYDVSMLINIEDFCLAQNTFIIETINQVIEDCNLKNKIEIKNLLKDKDIINNSKNVDRTICIGNSNLYNRLQNDLQNVDFYPYGIIDIYSDSNEFEELEKTVYEYLIQNQFESEIYDDLTFEDAIKFIKKDSYKFCSLLLSKDDKKIQVFKNNIDSEYVIVNKNPFREIKFSLNIK